MLDEKALRVKLYATCGALATEIGYCDYERRELLEYLEGVVGGSMSHATIPQLKRFMGHLRAIKADRVIIGLRILRTA